MVINNYIQIESNIKECGHQTLANLDLVQQLFQVLNMQNWGCAHYHQGGHEIS